MNRSLITAIVFCAALPAAWADTYYWVDENGKRHYGDKVPPQESKRERQVIDERGYTVKTLPKQRSAEEIAAEAEQAAQERERAEAEYQARAEQAKYDSILITTYDNVEAIEKVRDDRLGLLDSSISVEQEYLAENQLRLGKLREQEQAALKQGRPVRKKLRENIDDSVRRININEKNINELRRQRTEVEAKYNRDIARYRELTSASN